MIALCYCVSEKTSMLSLKANIRVFNFQHLSVEQLIVFDNQLILLGKKKKRLFNIDT